MAVSFVAASGGNSGALTATSFATALPTGWAANDVAVLTGHLRGAALTMATPAGWTPIPGITFPVSQASNSRAYGWYRVLQPGDTAPTISNSGAVTGGWSMQAFRGANPSAPIGQAGTGVGSATTVVLATLAGVLAGSMLAVGVHAGVSSGAFPTSITPGGGYTESVEHGTSRSTANSNQRMAAAYRLIASAGSYGGETFTADISLSMIALVVEVVAPVIPTVVKAASTYAVTARASGPTVTNRRTSIPEVTHG